MNQEKYNLNWHTYSDHLKEMLHEMMKSNELTDVTLVCDDKRQLKAHKIVLSACSSVFKSIVNDLPQNSSFIYLKGIQHQEMESILEFMYLGVATFHRERMNEFLNVAQNLEIKDISKDMEVDNGNVSTEEIPDHEEASEDVDLQTNTESERKVSSANSMGIKEHSQIKKTSEEKFTCDQCGRIFTLKASFIRHIQNLHEGVKHTCNQCDYQASHQTGLTYHIQSKHQGMKYACNQCDQQFTSRSNLTYHIQSKHEGVKYACNQCDQQSTSQSNLTIHIKSKHKGVKYACSKCHQQFTYQNNLSRHVKLMHKA